jgi:hypothetical protein
MVGRPPKRLISANIERDDYEILLFAGWCFSKEIREFCHASADIYRAMLGRPGLERISNYRR